MRSSSRTFFALSFGAVVCVAASACSLVVDFDRSKVHSTGGNGGHAGNGGRTNDGGATATGAAGGSEDGGSGGSGGGSGGTSNGGSAGMGGGIVDAGGDHAAPCELTTHLGCAADELCCNSINGPACRKTSVDECESCGTPCSATLSKSCSGRTCECDPASNRPCAGTGAESYCVKPASSDPRCVECRDASDCVGQSVGKTECVAGKCVECDPAATSAGCADKTPICAPTTLSCKPCSSSPDNCPGALVCTASGACGGCSASKKDCVNPTTPICDSGTTQCRGCTTNAECNTERGLAYCVNSSRCSACDPATEAGCSDATKPDCRVGTDGNFSCQPCTGNDNCANVSGRPVCDVGSGKCVECSADADCKGNAKKPLCDGNVCVACDTGSIAASADQRCSDKLGGGAVCVRNGAEQGQCGACDPGPSTGCGANSLCCERAGVPTCVTTSASECTACGVACNPTLANTCTSRGCRCGASAACTGTGTSRFCTGTPGSCVECLADSDCSDPTAPLCESNHCVACDGASNANTRCQAKQAGACASSGARKGRCSDCNPADNTGCGSSNQCDPTTATCVNCVNDAGCSGKNDKCDTTAHKCVDCTSTGGCADVPTTPICDSNACTACATDAECQTAPGSAGPLCGANGACFADGTCTSNGDCTDGRHKVCVDVSGSGEKRCRICNPGTNEGCSSGTCKVDYTCGP